jgi:hypothetical protein
LPSLRIIATGLPLLPSEIWMGKKQRSPLPAGPNEDE